MLDASAWDALVAGSRTDSIFVSWRWLKSALECYDTDHQFVGVWVRDKQGQRIGQAAFLHRRGYVKFLGHGPSDYLDIILLKSLSEADAKAVKLALLTEVSQRIDGFRHFTLSNIVEQANPPDFPDGKWEGWHVVPLHRMPAPFVSQASLGRLASRSSLRRVESRLRKQGEFTASTFHRAHDVLPRLEAFFDQHIRRWESTDCPSLFHHDCHRRFYRRATEALDDTGMLRFTELKLDGRLIASHFGFVSAGKFIWYKPAFEPDLADYSPGVALLGELARQAIKDGAHEFDFTIGAEPFKYRYADGERQVSKYYLTKSPVRALLSRAKLTGRRWISSTARRWGLKRSS